MGVLETVEDYITDVRTLLQDTISPYRYEDLSLLVAFNLALLYGRKLRPDLFVFKHDTVVPVYVAVNSAQVCIEPQFRQAFVYGTCAHALKRDQEDVQDSRANTFMADFEMMLTGQALTMPVQGGTPGASQQQGKR